MWRLVHETFELLQELDICLSMTILKDTTAAQKYSVISQYISLLSYVCQYYTKFVFELHPPSPPTPRPGLELFMENLETSGLSDQHRIPPIPCPHTTPIPLDWYSETYAEGYLTAPDRCYYLNQASLIRNKGRAGEFSVGETNRSQTATEVVIK